MPVVIDGNNLLHSLPRDRRSRENVRRSALDLVRNEGVQLIVVFDGPPPLGAPAIERLGRVSIRYSGGISADDVILSLLPAPGRASQWVVVTDDRALGERARDRGAEIRSLRQWLERRPRGPRRTSREPKLSANEVADWEAYFSTGRDFEKR